MLDRRGFLKIIGALGFAAATHRPALAEALQPATFVPDPLPEIPEPVRPAVKNDVVGLWVRPREKWINFGSIDSFQIQIDRGYKEEMNHHRYVSRRIVPSEDQTYASLMLRVADEDIDEYMDFMNGKFFAPFHVSIRTESDRFDLPTSYPDGLNSWSIDMMPGRPALGKLAFMHEGQPTYTVIQPKPKIGS